MAKKRRGLLAWLFGRRRADREFEPSVPASIERLVAAGLARAGHPVAAASAEPIAPDRVAAEAGAGSLAAFFHDTDVPELILLFPSSCPAAAFDGVADFLAPRGQARTAARNSYTRSRSPEETDDLLWRASACVSYRLTLEGGGPETAGIFALVDEAAAARTEKALETQPDYREAVRGLVLAREAAAGTPAPEPGPPRAVTVVQPRELAAGGLFLPPRVTCGRRTLEPRVAAAEESTGPGVGESGVWVRVSFQVASRQLAVWYFFPTRDEAAAVRGRETFKTVAVCLFRGSLASLAAAARSTPAAPAVAVGARPDSARRCLSLSAAVSAGAGRIACRVLVGQEDLAFLHAALHARASAPARVSGEPPDILGHLLCMSHDLLARRRTVFFRDLTGAGTGAAGDRAPAAAEGFFPVSLFLELATERDRAVVLQNRLLQFAGSRGLRRLFRYAAPGSGEGGPGPAPVTPFAFDEQGLLAMLPEKAREDWRRGGGADPGTEEEHRELCRAALEDVWRAARRKSILLSPRSLFILERMVMPDIRARGRKELDQARAAGVPFGGIRALPRPAIQGLFARVPNRTLCLAMVGEEAQLALVNANVSASRATVLSEDLAAARRLYQEGKLEPAELLEARRELQKAVEKLRDEERAREGIDNRGKRPAGRGQKRGGDGSGIPAVRR